METQIKISKDDLDHGWSWEGFLGGSYYNTLELAKIVQGRKSELYYTKLIKVKNKQGEEHYKIMLKLK